MLDRLINPYFEALCLAVAIAIFMLAGWQMGVIFVLAVCLAGAMLKMGRTDRGVTTLWEAMPAHQKEYFFPGAGHWEDMRPGMHNLILQSRSGQPFTALIGVKVDLPWFGIKFHTFGRVNSSPEGVAVTRTWLGRGPVTFMYLCSVPGADISVNYPRKGQYFKPDVTNYPHLFQLPL